MNAQMNPTLYPPQQAYGYGAHMPKGSFGQQFPPNPPNPGPFPPGQFPFNPPNVPPQHPQPIPQQFYQQFQQQQTPFARPQSRDSNGLTQVPPPPQTSVPFQHDPLNGPPFPQASTPTPIPSIPQQPSMAGPSTPATPQNTMQQRQQTPNPTLAQQAQMQNASQMQQRAVPQPTAALSPQSAARERARVTILLEINSHLLQEVVSLQTQGKAGSTPSQAQQSPTSPTSASDPSNPLSNSPVDPSKPASGPHKAPSAEFAECMRRLQANLAYLAAIADAKKKAMGTVPNGPAIMIPPPNVASLQDLYDKLNALFPEASKSTINKALAQASRPPAAVQAQG